MHTNMTKYIKIMSNTRQVKCLPIYQDADFLNGYFQQWTWIALWLLGVALLQADLKPQPGVQH